MEGERKKNVDVVAQERANVCHDARRSLVIQYHVLRAG
jgi:hypothetical protein